MEEKKNFLNDSKNLNGAELNIFSIRFKVLVKKCQILFCTDICLVIPL